MLRVIGYRDPRPAGYTVVETTSRSKTWSRGLSPFFVGPVDTYGGLVSLNMENAWQYAKVYAQHVGPDGEPTPEYFRWAANGWAKRMADRYPMGKGVRPEFSYWDGEHLTYVEARKRIYLPVYAKAVMETDAFRQLEQLHNTGVDIALLDFDGYDHKSLGMSYEQVLTDPSKKMGHAFVLAMLLEGESCVLT